MAITYTYFDAGSTLIQEVDDSTTPDTVRIIPEAVGNCDYDALVAAGTSIGAYVAPPAPALPTPAEKLAATGLTVEELQALLGF